MISACYINLIYVIFTSNRKNFQMKNFYFLLLLTGAFLLSGAELFVGPGKKYSTVTAGVKALKDGDTLTIAPGKYYESVRVQKPLKNVTIRAQFPGSVLIHGDKPAPRFTRVPGYRFVYAADWNDNVTAVNEKDSFRIYFPASDVRFLEFNFGFWFKKGNKLYISTSDGKAPEKHTLTVSVLKDNGLWIAHPENVVVDGLSFTGFYSHFRIGAWSGINGVQLLRPKKSVIRNCRSFFNANGISLSGGEDSVIENCVAFANGSQSPSSGGNIIGWSGTRNEIRNCLSMYKIFTGGSQGPIGIRFYGVMKDCKIINCRSFGEDGINIKGTIGNSYAENNYSERHINITNSRNNIFSRQNGYNPKDISPSLKIGKNEWHKHFADPENHDFRPLKDVIIGKVDNIVSGMSILLPPKVWSPLNFKADNVSISTRGAGKRAIVKGGNISGTNLKLEQLEITEPLKITGKNIQLRNCIIKGKLTVAAENIEIAHCHIEKAPDFTTSTGFHHSNTGLIPKSTLHDLEKIISLDGFEKGPIRVVRTPQDITVTGPFVYAVSDTSADIEWWTSSTAVASGLSYGETPQCEKKIGHSFSGSNWHSVSITGLTPGKKYYFRINSYSPLRTHHSNETLAELDRKMKRRRVSSSVSAFSTAAKKATPRTLKVTGSAIAPVLDKARPGDTVMIKGGVYTETLYLRSSGVTLRNVPGEKVWIDGKRTLGAGIILENKSDIVIDGIFFKEFFGGSGGGVVINGGSNITLRRCFYDGRSNSYTPVFIKANAASKLTLEHSAVFRGFHGANIARCPDLTIRNCIWSNNQINHISIHNLPEQKVFFTKNIFLDNIPGKIRNCLIHLWHLECFNEHSNWYYFRQPADKRLFIGYKCKNNRPAAAKAVLTYPQFVQAANTEITSGFGNPGFAAIPRLLQYKSDNFAEMTAFNKEFSSLECGLKNKKYTPWDFSLFKVTDPRCIKSGAGPDARLFTNGVAN